MATKTASRNGAVPQFVAQSDGRPVIGASPAAPTTIVDRLDGVNVALVQCRELLEAIHSRVSGNCGEKDCAPPQGANSLLARVSDAEYHSSDILAQLRELASAIGA